MKPEYVHTECLEFKLYHYILEVRKCNIAVSFSVRPKRNEAKCRTELRNEKKVNGIGSNTYRIRPK